MTTNKNKNGGSKTDIIMAQEEAEVDHFCWDSRDYDEVELMKGVKKEEGKEKWNQEETVGKRKTSQTTVTIQTNDASTTKMMAERMKEQGGGYVDDKSVLKTPVEAQWVLKLGSMAFNVRTALLALLKGMATVDDTIYLKTGETKVVVRNPADLPTAKEFMEQDAFQQNAVVSPGSIINVHPTLVQKEDLKAGVQAHMIKWSAPDTKDATQWLGKHHPEYCIGQPAPVPDFKL
eukprot:13874738-Ditylum_brightwellii.AAC.1